MAFDSEHRRSMDNFDKLPKEIRQLLVNRSRNMVITYSLLSDMLASPDLWVDILRQEQEMEDEEQEERLAKAA